MWVLVEEAVMDREEVNEAIWGVVRRKKKKKKMWGGVLEKEWRFWGKKEEKESVM